MLHKLGRSLQFAGLIILPLAIAGNLAGSLSLWQSLILSGAGMAVFYLGWLLQDKVQPK